MGQGPRKPSRAVGLLVNPAGSDLGSAAVGEERRSPPAKDSYYCSRSCLMGFRPIPPADWSLCPKCHMLPQLILQLFSRGLNLQDGEVRGPLGKSGDCKAEGQDEANVDEAKAKGMEQQQKQTVPVPAHSAAGPKQLWPIASESKQRRRRPEK
ncbi:hypothetical protein SKAU_G00225370 [Synaphobranchus kaupii]|uniref:Uncharacterized protein n=1 Tax=Synaphobranchus kaupii TaxID=118154 RepID=A0A9Q1FBS7_SYNKA|nr:hypothetical protein SKAU_G00225370 [Synaphobranchus kaupii]